MYVWGQFLLQGNSCVLLGNFVLVPHWKDILPLSIL